MPSDSDGTTAGTTSAETTDDPSTVSGASSEGSSSGSSMSSDGTTDAATTGLESDTDATSTDPVDTDTACVEYGYQQTPKKPDIMFVLDKSGSMVSETWLDDQNQQITRWSSLHDVVEAVLLEFGELMNAGLVLFPAKYASSSYDATACPVQDIPEKPLFSGDPEAILAAMPAADADANVIKGATPAALAIMNATDELLTAPANHGEQFILFVTDGAANCGEQLEPPALFETFDATVLDAVSDAYGLGIRTLVLGVDVEDALSPKVQDGNPDEINPHDELNKLAELGGLAKPVGDAKYLAADDDMALVLAFSKVAQEIVSCRIPLPENFVEPDEGEIVLYIDGEPYYDEGGCGDDGWMWSVDDEAFILCPATCEAYRMSMSPVIDVEIEC
ncbi:MAG: VWA domain-containing protein [Myxococcales bacterium]|nr:VWA domain-containing protein [Myxococcales bacterium]